jgi:hypothetical protein
MERIGLWGPIEVGSVPESDSGSKGSLEDFEGLLVRYLRALVGESYM